MYETILEISTIQMSEVEANISKAIDQTKTNKYFTFQQLQVSRFQVSTLKAPNSQTHQIEAKKHAFIALTFIIPQTGSFRGPSGVVGGLDPLSQAQICARELASVASHCLPLPPVASRCLPWYATRREDIK